MFKSQELSVLKYLFPSEKRKIILNVRKLFVMKNYIHILIEFTNALKLIWRYKDRSDIKLFWYPRLKVERAFSTFCEEEYSTKKLEKTF